MKLDAANAIPARMEWFRWTKIVFVVLSALSTTLAKKSTHINIAVDIGITSFGGSVYIREHYLIVNKKFIFWAQKKGRSLEKNLEKTAQNDDVFGSSPVQRLALQKNIYKSHLKKWGRKNPETVAVSGFFGVISISVTLDGGRYRNRTCYLLYVKQAL